MDSATRDSSALDCIRDAWIEWATQAISENEFASRVSDALDTCGKEVPWRVATFLAANDA